MTVATTDKALSYALGMDITLKTTNGHGQLISNLIKIKHSRMDTDSRYSGESGGLAIA